ncbi:MAG: undecaprenyl-diphosphate phosphatase [Ruminococcus sp.]|nr:undecaprenyl-diphosphate phosphatase [Ruminococcus sp.]
MSILEAVIQGLIQGITEFLPVSSSGHLSLFQHFTKLSGEEAAFTTLALHLGTLIAVFIAFREKILRLIKEAFAMLRDIFTGKFTVKELSPDRRMILMIIVSILPLFVFYIFRDFFYSVQEDNDIAAEGICFLFTAALLTVGDKCSKRNNEKGIGKTAGETTVSDALFIGIMQGVALLPGVSRSGSTISSGLICGQKREEAVEYSFILGIPVILAGALSKLRDAGGEGLPSDMLPILIGTAVAAVSGYFAIFFIKWLMRSDRFGIFAVYTFILGLTVTAIGIYEHLV